MAGGILLRLARQWIAGENASDGIARVRIANGKGISGLLNLLGEHIESRGLADSTLLEYTKLLDLIQESGVDSQISAKPSQLGINIDYEYCVSNYQRLAECCSSHGRNWLWIDMEDSNLTDKTITLYRKVLEGYENTGLAIQAYLKRSVKDLGTLIQRGSRIRLVKGAYNEPASIAFKGKERVRESYSHLLEMLFRQKAFFAVATHDSILVDEAKEFSRKYGNRNFEFEMLLGVRDALKEGLVRENFKVREYVPYGPEWLPYSMRRLREKKSNLLLLGRSIFYR